ncbi:hypothetical protein OAO87_00320 [bacterium]|nr:hypothetical protein [bacterium]
MAAEEPCGPRSSGPRDIVAGTSAAPALAALVALHIHSRMQSRMHIARLQRPPPAMAASAPRLTLRSNFVADVAWSPFAQVTRPLRSARTVRAHSNT